MPLGIQRLNAKKTQSNDRIVFIKPLKGADEAIAQDFLERIAAQCRTEPHCPFPPPFSPKSTHTDTHTHWFTCANAYGEQCQS